MKALVTGGAGFIGSHISRRLSAEGHSVRIFDNYSTGHRRNLRGWSDDIEVIQGDLRDLGATNRAVAGCEVVFHQAALPSVPRSIRDPLASNATNLLGTLNLLLAARDAGVQRVVLASSSSVYGDNPHVPKREDMLPLPISPYAVAKLGAEGYCHAFSQVYGLETVALRYFNVFGPSQDPTSAYAAVIPKFITALSSGQRPTVFGDGEQSRDFTFVADVVDANLLAAAPPGVSPAVYNVACGRPVTINQLAETLQQLLRLRLAPVHVEGRAGEVRASHADIGKAVAHLGYRPLVTLEEGLSRTIAWYERERAQYEWPGA